MTLNDEITLAIQKNLPSAVAGELKEYLAQAEKDKKTIKFLEEEKRNLVADKKFGESEIFQLQRLLDAHQHISERDDAVTKREIKLDVTLANMRAEAAEKRVEVVENLVGTVFRNPIVKRNTFKSEGQNSVYNSNGSYTSTPNGNVTETETVTEE